MTNETPFTDRLADAERVELPVGMTGEDREPEAIPPELPAESRGAALPLNDYGNGCRLVLYFGENILFVPRLGWLRWDGRRWAADEDEIEVRRDAQKIAAHILTEAEYIEIPEWQQAALDDWEMAKPEADALRKVKPSKRDEDQRERLVELSRIETTAEDVRKSIKGARRAHTNHAKASGNSSKISNMLLEAKPAVAVSVDEMNADPMQVCTANGVLEFYQECDPHGAAWGEPAARPAVRLLAHDRGQRITKMVRADYDPEAACPTFMAFLERIMPDPELRGFLQRWFGYSLTGSTAEQKLAFLYGGGRNGKSTLVDVIAKILDDYAGTIPIETLTGTEQRKGSEATPDLVRLPGSRLVRASEPEQGQKMKEALIKALTGGEPILVRRMMQEFVEIVPQFKLTISGNYKPEVRGADDGIWRRIMLVPFAEQIAKDEVDGALPVKLWAERDGILGWLVGGCLEWMRGGLRPPEVVVAATEEYRRHSDPMRLFLETECDITGQSHDFETARDLGDAFNCWLVEKGTSIWGARQTSNQLLRRSENVAGSEGQTFAPVKRSNTGYAGILLKSEARDRIAQFSDRLRAGR